MDEFDQVLSAAGQEIMRYRNWYVEKLNAVSRQVHGHISMSRENLQVEYRPSVKEDMLTELRAARETDPRRATTSVGVHRDDLALLIDGHEARLFGSQGQQRTAALSLRLSELTVMKNESGEWPVLMLDDVMSELEIRPPAAAGDVPDRGADADYLHGSGRPGRRGNRPPVPGGGGAGDPGVTGQGGGLRPPHPREKAEGVPAPENAP